MTKDVLTVAGWIIGIEGALGTFGLVRGEEPWGFLDVFWELPVGAYVALLVLGAVTAGAGELVRKRS
ncbi:hypothetical protein AB0G74_26230 [Streptomyces sp. NPDC020875]|uniref:hypothetical protein n=1 Tax=Streptomyces sp. NPDC020875 TaxID=3154898 RepID=UPI0033D8BEEC